MTSLVIKCGEAAIDEDRAVLRLVMHICGDTNYKIRTDGAVLFKIYLRDNQEVLKISKRLEQTYIPEVIELCNDEEIFIRIQALEAIFYVVEKIETDLIESEIIPPLLKILQSDHDEVIEPIS